MADKRITDLPQLTTADAADQFAIVDDSANITKRVRADGMIPPNTVTASKMDLTTLPAAQQAWQTPTLLNSWANFGTPYANARYMKDSLGFVHLSGLVKNGSPSTSNVMTLPAGYRPSNQLLVATPNNGQIGVAQVTSGGDVSFPIIPGGTGYVSLDCISFKAEL